MGFIISNIVLVICISLFYIFALIFSTLRPFIFISGSGYRLLVLSSIWRNIIVPNYSNINSYYLSMSQVCVCIVLYGINTLGSRCCVIVETAQWNVYKNSIVVSPNC